MINRRKWITGMFLIVLVGLCVIAKEIDWSWLALITALVWADEKKGD